MCHESYPATQLKLSTSFSDFLSLVRSSHRVSLGFLFREWSAHCIKTSYTSVALRRVEEVNLFLSSSWCQTGLACQTAVKKSVHASTTKFRPWLGHVRLVLVKFDMSEIQYRDSNFKHYCLYATRPRNNPLHQQELPRCPVLFLRCPLQGSNTNLHFPQRSPPPYQRNIYVPLQEQSSQPVPH